MIIIYIWAYAIICLLSPPYMEGHIYIYRVLILSTSFDLYTVTFFKLLGVIRGSVGVWSYYYMDREPSYRRFFYLLLIFLGSMVSLIFFSNVYITLIGWDLLGVTSFLLVIYYKNRKCLGSGMITGLTNRLGDCFFLCGLGFSFVLELHLRVLLWMLLRMTKSAQFPFSSWLPSAMAAPTPVSALVHSSTLVTAGVYVLIRYCNIDINTLLIAGSCTLMLAGTRACLERDLKKVVALRTLSQLGVMIVSIGAIEKSYCFFHLLSHACFKALLFICVGIRIHTVYGTQDYRRFNSIPTMWTSLLGLVSILSLMGFVYTSGFHRKELILEILFLSEFNSIVLLLFLFGVFCTTCYSVKMISVTILSGHYTWTGSMSHGGFSWLVKGPLFLMGCMSVIMGSSSGRFIRSMSVSLNIRDKMLPLLLIISGTVTGFLTTRMNRSIIRRLWNLTPTTQVIGSVPVMWDHRKSIDKGWIEIGMLSLTPIAISIIHYSTVYSLGLRLLLIVFIW